VKVLAWQEADGSDSMRRILALYFSLMAGACLVIAALQGTMSGVWGGLVCVAATLVLLGYTTVSDIIAFAKSVRNIARTPDKTEMQ